MNSWGEYFQIGVTSGAGHIWNIPVIKVWLSGEGCRDAPNLSVLGEGQRTLPLSVPLLSCPSEVIFVNIVYLVLFCTQSL